jgi:hypothetical protein
MARPEIAIIRRPAQPGQPFLGKAGEQEASHWMGGHQQDVGSFALEQFEQWLARLPIPEKMRIGDADEIAVPPIGKMVQGDFPARRRPGCWLAGLGRRRWPSPAFLQPGSQFKPRNPLHPHSGRRHMAAHPVRSRPGPWFHGDHQCLNAIGRRILGKGPGPQGAWRLQRRIPECQDGDFGFALVHCLLQVRTPPHRMVRR